MPRSRPGLPLGALLVATLAAAGACEPTERPPEQSAPVVSAAPRAEEPPPPTAGKPVTFESEDGATLAGDLYLAKPDAPAVVLVHRLFGERSEWAPLVESLRRADQRYTVLTFDLRGHGASKAPEKKPSADSKTELARDVKAAIEHVLGATKEKARGVVLVGSSFGATLASLVAFDQPKVTALALVSPGAAIRGVDLYRPYSEVRNLPTFIAGAEADTVSRDPLDAVGRMAQRGKVQRYPGARHGAEFLGQEHPRLWKDLGSWLASVYDEAPVVRRSLYYAPGKEPEAKKKKAEARARSRGGG